MSKEDGYKYLEWIYGTVQGVPIYEYDDGHYTNHSHRTPNITIDEQIDPTGLDCFAMRDIAIGEEITTDYLKQWGRFPSWFNKILDEYHVDYDYTKWTL